MIERIISRIDGLNHKVGEGAIWFTLAMIVLQCLIVILSKVFGISFTPLDESIWYLNGLIFMLGASYTLLHNRHVRVDLIYREASDKYKARVDFWGSLLFILPVAFMTFGLSWGFILDSWYNFSKGEWNLERAEGTPTSLPLISAFKTVIWVYSFLLALAGLSLAAKAGLYLTGHRDRYTPEMATDHEALLNKEAKS